MGQKQRMNPDIITDYQYAGAIHILSFQDCGILMLFLTFILSQFLTPKETL
jgi:competence protein ComEC